MMTADRLECSALGRTAFIGELYDARTESFSSQSLLKASLPPELVQCTDINQTEFEYKTTDTISERFDLFKVQGELQVAVLLGLVKLDGSAKFLMEEAKSEKVVSCSLACKLRTVNEKLISCFADILPHLDLEALKEPQFTHVVVEVNWGANCLLSLESSCKADSNKKDIQGRLEADLSTLSAFLSVKGRGDMKYAKEGLEKIDGVSIKVNADVLPTETWPTTVEDFLSFLNKVPELVRNVNKGKGKPLSYAMVPLSGFRRLAKFESMVESEVKKIDESFLSSLIMLFEEVTVMKQKFHDLLNLMKDNQKFIPRVTVKEVKKKQEEMLSKEAELKCLVREEWVSVKAGKKALKDLVRLVETFKNRSLRLISYEDFLDSLSSIPSKLATALSYTSRGVLYLGEEDKFDQVQMQHPSSEFIVLVTSTDLERANSELHRNNCFLFSRHVDEHLPNTLYVVVDLDLCGNGFLNEKLNHVRCFHLVGNKILSRDMLADDIAHSKLNFARLKQSVEIELCKHKPGNRAVLEMPCPGFKDGTCPSNAVEWTCFSCKTNIEYGFNDFFYCSCGAVPADSYEYRCSSPKHQISPFRSFSPESLREILSKLRPLKEMNVVLIGQSGVGKTTWLNSIFNYLAYSSLDEGMESGVIVVIPMKIPMTDPKTGKQVEIQVGKDSENEVMDAGKSATQFCRTYSFLWEDRCVRIIDTPGLGDTRGIEQDKENLKNIIEHLSNLKEIHGVCILLKANDNRLNVLFGYCVKELLTHLHKSVAKNIVFCFTNSRTTVYTPGRASTILNNLLENLGIESLSLGIHNRFCLDNEAFLFLCTLENGMKYDSVLYNSFQNSWEISLKETKRLLNTIKNFTPHNLEETVSLVTSRMRVISLTNPLAEVNKTIHLNIQLCSRRREELNLKKGSLREMLPKLHKTRIELIPVPLSKPRTVCTSSNCITYVSLGSDDVNEIEYTTHCHRECNLKNVTLKTVNNYALRDCRAMDSRGICTKCKCSYAKHMHLAYTQKREERRVVDKSIQQIMESEMSEKEKLEEILKNLDADIAKYKEEAEFIVRATAKFGLYLKKNAISVYNDKVEDYLLQLILEEENKPMKSQNEVKYLERLKLSLEAYKEEVKVLTEAIESGVIEEEVLTPKEVYELENKLYSLELTGETIRKFVSLDRASIKRSMNYHESVVQLGKGQKKGPLAGARKFVNKVYLSVTGGGSN